MDTSVDRLSDLAEMEHPDAEMVPDILVVDARLSLRGSAQSLADFFSRAAAVAPSKEVVPGTLYSLVEAVASTGTSSSYARITASDGDQTVSAVTDAVTVITPGRVLVPARRFLDILKLAPAEAVRIDVMGTAAIIRSGRAQWTVQTPVGEDLATVPDISALPLRTTRVDALLAALVPARRAVASSGSRPALMQLLVRNGQITGCDGGRLHRVSIRDFDVEADFSIPTSVADELIKALRASDSETIQFGYDQRHLVFEMDNGYIIAQQFLVSYPNVENVILGPAISNTSVLSFDPKELAEVVKRVRVNADPDYPAVFLTMVPLNSGWSLAVRARDRQGNGSQEVIECSWTGPAEQTPICLNHKHLSDLLACLDTDLAIFNVGADTKTQKFPLYVSNEDSGFVGVLQQMRADWV